MSDIIIKNSEDNIRKILSGKMPELTTVNKDDLIKAINEVKSSIPTSVQVVDNLTSTSVDKALSANQGKVLDTNKLNKTEAIGKKGTGESAEIFNSYTINQATGQFSHAEGQSTTAGGFGSHAEGVGTIVRGTVGHAEGQSTQANGNTSHAEGLYTIAHGDCQHVQGKNNIEDTEDKYAHIVGNGQDIDIRSNAHTIDWNGMGWFKGGLKIGGNGQDDTAAVEVATKADLDNAGVGKKGTGEGAEIFNDYTNNQATGQFSHAGGYNSKAISDYSFAHGESVMAGIKGFNITNFDSSTKTYTLDSVEGLVINNVFSIIAPGYGSNKNIGKITAIDTANGTVTVDTFVGQLGPNNYFSVLSDVGNVVIGEHTFAEGYKTVSSGEASHAEGQYTMAAGEASHAEGHNTIATYAYSHAEGSGTKAFNYDAHAEGSGTKAVANASHAEGGLTTASGQYSHAEGYQSIAEGANSHAEGSSTAKGANSHAEGDHTYAYGTSSHAEGTRTITGTYGFLITDSNNTNKTYTLNSVKGLAVDDSFSLHSTYYTKINCGKITAIDTTNKTITVNEYYSPMECGPVVYLFILNKPYIGLEMYEGSSSDNSSHAEGYATQALNLNTHAEGNNTFASSEGAHAEGVSTSAKAFGAHAEGFGTSASGQNSHAEGYYTLTQIDNQHVQGKYNIPDATGRYAHIVGNGTSDTKRSNAHTVDWSGNAWFAGNIKVGGTGQEDTSAKEVAIKDEVTPRNTVSGYPIVLTDHLKNENILSCNVYGNCGKNLIPYPYDKTTEVRNGVTFTDNGDGTLTVNGTATSNTYFIFNDKLKNIIDISKKYILSGSSDITVYVALYQDNTWKKAINSNNGKPAILDFPNYTDIEYNRILVATYVPSGKTVNNAIVKPMIELGETATEFEKYEAVGDLDSTSGKYIVPVTIEGKNMLRIVSSFTVNEAALNMKVNLLPGTYTLSWSSSVWGGDKGPAFQFQKNNIKVSSLATEGGYEIVTLTVPENSVTIYSNDNFSSSTNVTSTINELQLEKGTIATEYEKGVASSTVTISLDKPLNLGEYVDVINKKRINGDSETEVTVTGELKTVDSEENTIVCGSTVSPSKIEIEYYQDITKALKVNNITSITSTVSNNTLVLNSRTDTRLTSTDITTLTLQLPTTIEEDYECYFSFKSGSTATRITMPTDIKWVGVDCNSSKEFIPSTNTIYEVGIRCIGFDSEEKPILTARVGGY